MNYTANQIVEVAKRAEGFTKVPTGLWLAAIRSNPVDRIPNEFNCVVNLMQGEKIVMTTTCTTVAGLPALQGGFNRYNSKGAGIVCANIWMYDTFKFGLHSGRMRALRMIKPVWSTRDGNKNKVAEEYGERYWGNIYANFHGSTYDRWAKLIRRFIGEWSYACIVCNNNEEYNKIIDKCEHAGPISMVILEEFSI